MRLTPIKIASQSLRRNKTRTLLTVLGIVIGITAVITVMSAGNGLKSYVSDQIKTFGTNTIQTEIKVPTTGKTSAANAAGIAQGIQITTLTEADAEAIRKLPNVKNNYAYILGQQVVSYHEINKQILIWGTTASFVDIDSTKVALGQFFSNEDDRSEANVVVIGSAVSDTLFGQDDPLGKLIKIGTQKYTVIGVMNKRGSVAFFNLDNLIYMPLRTLQKKVMGVDHVTAIFTQVYDEAISDQTADDITVLLRQRHNITDPNKDDFAVTTMAEALNIYNTIFGAVNLLLVAIAGISLVVGGVGIMNIMYVSVLERTYEIGLRKSLGATHSNILWQFLWEAIMVTLVGAILGLLLGFLFSFLISVVAASQGISWSFAIPLDSVVLAGGVSLAIGLVFGVFPALAAAKLDPVTALRSAR